MARLIDDLENTPQGTEVRSIGFNDNVRAFEAKRQLSQVRAGAVSEEGRKVARERLGHLQMTTAGFGEVTPSACNVTDRGRLINRRVEVWISDDT